MAIDHITAEADLVRTALQQKYVESIPGESVIRVTADGSAEPFVLNGEDRPNDAVDLPPERFVGDLALPDPDADLNDEEIEKLAERLGSEVRPELEEEVTVEGRSVPVEYVRDDP